MRHLRILALVAVAASCACRASSREFDRGRQAARSGEWDAAVRYYERALADDPDNVEYRIALKSARLEAARAHRDEARKLVAAGDVDAAVEELELALELDPTSRYVRAELEALRDRRAAEVPAPAPERVVMPLRPSEPVLGPDSSAPLRLSFPEGTSLRTVLVSLGELAGVNVLFDESFRDKRVAVELDGVTFREALELLLETNGLFYKEIASSSVLVTEEK